jgi:hypothetical protein
LDGSKLTQRTWTGDASNFANTDGDGMQWSLGTYTLGGAAFDTNDDTAIAALNTWLSTA